MQTAFKNLPDFVEPLYRGISFNSRFEFQDPLGNGIDLTGKRMKVTFREQLDLSLSVIKTLITDDASILVGFGFFTLKGWTEITSQAVVVDYMVGTVLLESAPNVWEPLFLLRIRVQDSSTVAPSP